MIDLRKILVGTAAIISYLLAFTLQGTPGDAARAAIAFGVLSAIAWAVAGYGTERFNRRANIFAALFAAAFAGFSTPDIACDGGYFKYVCSIRTQIIEAGFAPNPSISR